jgi:chloride channel protein, CIC family
VFEMTQKFDLVPGLMLGALVSQAIARRLNHENFYDALLTQDGHRLEHVRPPRDLQTWHQLPVSAIANFQPVVMDDLSPARLRQMLAQHPYQRFPVVLKGQFLGILTRKEAELGLSTGRSPNLEKSITCLPGQSIRELQGLLIESASQAVVLLDRPGGTVIGLVTLHDLLRAEMAKAKSAEETE